MTIEIVEALGNADDRPSICQDGGLGGGAYDGVEAGRIAASGADTDAADL